MPALTPQDIQVVRWGPPGPAGAGITASEKTAFDSRIAAIEGRVLSGAGSPEGAVVGDTGDLYGNTTGITGQTLWQKAGTSGTDGWSPIDGAVRAGIESHALATPNAATIQAFGMSAWTLAGTATNNDHFSGPAVAFATSGVLNNDAGPNGPAEFRRDWGVDATFRVITGSDLTNARIWVALADGDPSPNNAPGTINLAGFRYEAGVLAGNWGCRGADGAAGSEADSGVAVAASAAYRLRLLLSGSAVRFYVNDTLVVQRTTNLPTSSAYLRPWVRVRNIGTAGVRSVEFAHFNAWHT